MIHCRRQVIADYSNLATAASTASAAELGGGLGGVGGVGGCDDKFGRAEALVARAGCLRRARRLTEAIKDCDAALLVFPKYARALFRRALCLLESQRPAEAKAALEQLLRVDRTWPRLLDWLIRAAAQEKRQEAGKATGADFTAEDEDSEGKNCGGNEVRRLGVWGWEKKGLAVTVAWHAEALVLSALVFRARKKKNLLLCNTPL